MSDSAESRLLAGYRWVGKIFNGGWIASHAGTHEIAEPASGPATPAAGSSPPMTAAPQPDVTDQLKKLGDLRDAGILTTEEFESKKAELLARL